MAGLVAGGVGAEIFNAGADAFNAAAAIDQDRQKMIAGGVQPKRADDLIARAREAARATPGITIEQAVEAGMDLRTVLGGKPGDPASVAFASQALPAFVRNLGIFKQLGEDNGDQSFAGVKAAELLGQLTDDATGGIAPQNLQKFLDESARVANATRGRVSPTDFLAFVKNARASDLNLSDDYLYKVLPSLFLEGGASKTGTGEMAAWRQFEAGTMTQAKFGELQKLGLVDDKAQWANGHVADMPAHLKDSKLFDSNPAEWVWNVLQPAMAANGITDRVAQAQFAGTFMTNTGGGLVSALIAQKGAIQKDMRTLGVSETGGQAQDALNAGAGAQLNTFQAAFHNFMTDAGGALLPQVTANLGFLTKTLNDMGQAAKDHPVRARVAENAAGVVAGAATGVLAGTLIGAGVGAAGGPIGAGAGAIIGGGIGAAGMLVAEAPKQAPALLANAATGGVFGMVEQFIEALQRHFPKSAGGRMQVELPADKSVPVHIDNTDALTKTLENRFADRLNAPPSGPGGVDPNLGGQHPGQHN